MDGRFEDPSINLKKVMFWPDNIVQLFREFRVKTHFDLLSVDMDSYDWFMLERILEAGYRPRVIVVEININMNMDEAKSILPPPPGEPYKMFSDKGRYFVREAYTCNKKTKDARITYNLVMLPGRLNAGNEASPEQVLLLAGVV